MDELEAQTAYIGCETGVPCEYEDNVDLRVIVLVQERDHSLQKCLESLQTLELDGASAALEIWVDRYKISGHFHMNTVEAALKFQWKKGRSRVHIHKRHVGVSGQWIYTWRPSPNTTELAIYLEDDVDVSPYAYRWLLAAHKRYGNLTNTGGYSLYEGNISGLKKHPQNDVMFMFHRFESYAFAPHPRYWRGFQDWYHTKVSDPSFRPYSKRDTLSTARYKKFEILCKQKNLWNMWFTCYTDDKNLFTVYPNIGMFMRSTTNNNKPLSYLAYHRKENGLHFSRVSLSSNGKLIQNWQKTFVKFPDIIPRYDFNGRRIIDKAELVRTNSHHHFNVSTKQKAAPKESFKGYRKGRKLPGKVKQKKEWDKGKENNDANKGQNKTEIVERRREEKKVVRRGRRRGRRKELKVVPERIG